MGECGGGGGGGSGIGSSSSSSEWANSWRAEEQHNLLLELLPNLLTPRAAAIIVGLVRHLGSYQRYGRDRDVVACWGRSTSCIICLCPGKVNDDDESVKFAS